MKHVTHKRRRSVPVRGKQVALAPHIEDSAALEQFEDERLGELALEAERAAKANGEKPIPFADVEREILARRMSAQKSPWCQAQKGECVTDRPLRILDYAPVAPPRPTLGSWIAILSVHVLGSLMGLAVGEVVDVFLFGRPGDQVIFFFRLIAYPVSLALLVYFRRVWQRGKAIAVLPTAFAFGAFGIPSIGYLLAYVVTAALSLLSR